MHCNMEEKKTSVVLKKKTLQQYIKYDSLETK